MKADLLQYTCIQFQVRKTWYGKYGFFSHFIQRLAHPEFTHTMYTGCISRQIANSINKRFASLEGNISCVLKSRCINLYINNIDMIFPFRFSFTHGLMTLSNHVSKIYDVTSATLIELCDSALKGFYALGFKIYISSRKHTFIILTPLDPTCI